jgi:signal transduction histidine kinase
MLLAGTIAGRCAVSPRRGQVRRRIRSRVEIPDFTGRRDEIGDLSGALRDMTNALYSRIEAIESFAADVAHELRNPLTSLRSAVETLPLAKTDQSRLRLLAVIEHDVRRLDRLISDISDASRLDAELQRQEAAPVDLAKVLDAPSRCERKMHRRYQQPDADIRRRFRTSGRCGGWLDRSTTPVHFRRRAAFALYPHCPAVEGMRSKFW